ncbi:kinesin-like protein costa isoform X2 [Neocloeon triangulifer]|uniref:kinesin-like protein costa isoform X2 n=1 Tax=Neocloeon triangulifer TaxID=2078957 RepID=UPI00286ED0C5|nr:kinesin-like protein costa isoform X2 [Neocloeon triangulifer]
MEVSVTVASRVRPPPSDGLLPDDHINITTGPYPDVITVNNVRSFQFDYVIPMEHSQHQMFQQTVEPLIQYVLEGYDVTMIAYGQVDSGKSYTVLGPGMHCALSETEYGMLPRTTREIFSRMKNFPNRKIKIYVSFVEIYQEVLRDLLNPESTNLHVQEDPCMGVKVEGTEYLECQNTGEVLSCMMTGLGNKHPDDNSHTIFTLVIDQLIPSSDDSILQKVSQVMFVDLAGQERLCSEGSVRLDTSLAAFNNLVHSLATQKNYEYLPYRESKLTHLLKTSLGGRAITTFLCCVSPLASDTSDTLATLNFGEIVKAVRNRPTMNTFVRKLNTACDENGTRNVNGSSVKELSENIFGIEFVMGQWRNLLTDAEELFQNLSEGKSISRQEVEQIQRWLCLKQECEEIAESQQTESLSKLLQKSLDALGLSDISENRTSEDETKAEANNNNKAPTSKVRSQNSDSSDAEEVVVYRGDIFEGKSSTTTGSDDEKEGRGLSTPELQCRMHTCVEQFRSMHNSTIVENAMSSLIQVEEVQPEKFDFSLLFKDSVDVEEKESTSRLVTRRNSLVPPKIESGKMMSSTVCEDIVIRSRATRNTPLTDSDIDAKINKKDLDPVKAKQNRLKRLIIEMQSAYKRIDDLQKTVELKEELLKDLIAHADLRRSSKHKLEIKYKKAMEMVSYCSAKLAQAEKSAAAANPPSRHLHENVDKCKSLCEYYNEQLEDISNIHKLLENTSKKAIDLERSLTNSRRQLEKLKRHVRKEEKVKEALQKEQLMLRTASPQIRPESCGIPLDEDLSTDGSVDTLEANEEFDMEEDDVPAATPENESNPQWHRKEIFRLRKTKNAVITDLIELRQKLKETKQLDKSEHWKLFELEEAIDAIDATIELKNEMICRNGVDFASNYQKDESEEMLLKRLSGLTLKETKMLLYKYFKKCIDMRDGGRQLAAQLAQQDTHSEILAWKLHSLTLHLHEARVATERQFLAISDSGQHGSEAMKTAMATRFDLELRKGDRVLKKKMEEKRLMLHTRGGGAGSSSHHVERGGFSALGIPHLNLTELQGALALQHQQQHGHSSSGQHVVTREKGKLVIQKRKGREYHD